MTRLRDSCERAIVLCGTPAPNSPADVVNQIDIADQGIAFAGRRISTDRRLAAQEVKEGLEGAVVLRRLKQDVFPDLAAKQTVKAYLALSPTQRRLYERARKDLVESVRNADEQQFRRSLTTFLAQRVRLLQICSNPRAVDPLYDEIPAKLKALDRLLRELVEEQGQKVVVWSYFRTSLDAIAERYSRYGCVRMTDRSRRSMRESKRSIDFSTMRVFGYSSGTPLLPARGITLTAAHHAIYESFSNQAAHYMQSIDGSHRRGQTQDVISHVLNRTPYDRGDGVALGLVDKERAGRQLLGDDYSEADRPASGSWPTSNDDAAFLRHPHGRLSIDPVRH